MHFPVPLTMETAPIQRTKGQGIAYCGAQSKHVHCMATPARQIDSAWICCIQSTSSAQRTTLTGCSIGTCDAALIVVAPLPSRNAPTVSFRLTA